MRPPTDRWHLPWGVLLPAVCLLCLPACLLVVTTGPTTVDNANIVFVAKGDGGVHVAALLITVSEEGGAWRGEGRTSWDGLYRCDVPSGVARVRVTAVPPAGYVLTEPDAWPRALELRSGESVDVEVRVTAERR